MEALVTQLCPTLCNPMAGNPTGSLSMEFSRQEFWSGLPFPFPGDLPDPGIKPESPALQAYSLPFKLLGEALKQVINRTYRYVIQNGERPLLQLLLCLPTLCNYKDYRPPSSSAHGIFQAKILEWITISFSRGIFLTQGLKTHFLLGRQILYHWVTRKYWETTTFSLRSGPRKGCVHLWLLFNTILEDLTSLRAIKEEKERKGCR